MFPALGAASALASATEASSLAPAPHLVITRRHLLPDPVYDHLPDATTVCSGLKSPRHIPRHPASANPIHPAPARTPAKGPHPQENQKSRRLYHPKNSSQKN